MEELIEALRKLSSTDIIALLALFVSGISAVLALYALYLQKKLNSQNLQAIYFEKIFHKYILREIPTTAAKLNFDVNGKLNKNYRDVNKVMMEMVKNAKYFAYANNNFFCELQNRTQELEDMLLELSNKQISDICVQKDELILAHEKIAEIITYINKCYCK